MIYVKIVFSTSIIILTFVVDLLNNI